MTVVCDNVKRIWYIYSALDFIKQFKLNKKKIMKEYRIQSLDDLYGAKGFGCDEDFIREYLEEDKRLFRFSYNDDSEYFIIQEIEEPIKVPADMICELCHELTARECKLKKITLDKPHKTGEECQYTTKAQRIFDYYYDLVTTILNV